MRKGKSIIGINVLSQADRTHLGHVKDLIFDHETNEVLALLISEKDLFGFIDAQVVPWHQVRGMGPDAVIVESAASVVKAGAAPRVTEVMNRDTVLSGTRIYTTDGQHLGTLADMYLDEVSGHVVGYEVSSGFISDTIRGKQFLPASGDISIGRVALVPPEAAGELEIGTPGVGALGVESDAPPEDADEAAPTSLAAAGLILTEPYDPTANTIGDIHSNRAEVPIEQQDFVIGKIAARDVIIPAAEGPESDGTESEVLVREGEWITRAHATIAEARGVLPDLVMAVSTAAPLSAGGANPVRPAPSPLIAADVFGHQARYEVLAPDGSVIIAAGTIITPEIMDHARIYDKESAVIAAADRADPPSDIEQSIEHGVEALKEGALHLWDTVKQKASELAVAAQAKMAEHDVHAEQAKIDNALGRPVTRAILDHGDNIILPAGEIITHAAVARAREAGVLHLLLDSVYTGLPPTLPEATAPQDIAPATAATPAHPEGIFTPVTPERSASDTLPDTPSAIIIPPGAATGGASHNP